MLDMVFMRVLDMTATASIVIAVVLVARLLLKKAPKIVSYALWAVVLFRLLCPFSIQAPVSLLPAVDPVSEHYTLADEPISVAGAGIAAYHAVGDALNGGLGIQHIPTAERNDNGNVAYVTSTWWEVWILFGQYVWLAGIAAMLAYSVISYHRTKRKLVGAVLLRDNIYQSDYITSPFVMGLFSPKIYLPSSLSEREEPYILLHEQRHIKRLDHVTRALSYLALCVHWFNPLVWLAFALSARDMEMSCDEAVIRELGPDIRADYSTSLLSLATGRRVLPGTPLAFGEGDAQGRIRNLSRWKKPALGAVLVAAILCAVLAGCLLTDPAGDGADEPGPSVPGQSLGSGDTPEPSPAGSDAPEAPLPLDEATAERFIDDTLSTLALHEGQTVTFSLPAQIPTDAERGSKLVITLNATFSEGQGVYNVQKLLDGASDWTGGYNFEGRLDTDRGGLVSIMLRVAFMTQISENTYKEFAANYVTFTASFSYDELPKLVGTSSRSTEDQRGVEFIHRYSLRNGDRFEISFIIPDRPGDTSKWRFPSFYELATQDAEALSAIDTGADQLPMQIFATVALSNHAGYTDYTVRRSTPTGASATAKFVWKDLLGSDPAAAQALADRQANFQMLKDWADHCLAELMGALTAGGLSTDLDTAREQLVRLDASDVPLDRDVHKLGFSYASLIDAIDSYQELLALIADTEQALIEAQLELYASAAEVPWQEVDCLLAYDWAVMPYFIELRPEPGIFTADQLAAIAASITIAAVD